jgi:hypothetical protein
MHAVSQALYLALLSEAQRCRDRSRVDELSVHAEREHGNRDAII